MTGRQALRALALSWTAEDSPVTPWDQVAEWLRSQAESARVDIRKITLDECSPWYMDRGDGLIKSGTGGFFSIGACRWGGLSQPLILQPEVGCLGILCREFDGVMHLLMQAKVEPGNINAIQLSPTLQATASNQARLHGGAAPAYLEFFRDPDPEDVIYDSLQSEQAARFWKKRNRNIMVLARGHVPVLPSHRWLTLGQIKRLMRRDNAVNMDTRTVLGSIPFCLAELTEDQREGLRGRFRDRALFDSVFSREADISGALAYLDTRRSGPEPELMGLDGLTGWHMRDGELRCDGPWPFKVIFCDISIEGREVRRWRQPLLEAVGSALFGLLRVDVEGTARFLVRARREIGSFDGPELGPTVQREPVGSPEPDALERFFLKRLDEGRGVTYDRLQSEEGGRFYHEQNRNVLMTADIRDLPPLTEGWFLLTHRELTELVRTGCRLNIQLRDLISLLEA